MAGVILLLMVNTYLVPFLSRFKMVVFWELWTMQAGCNVISAAAAWEQTCCCILHLLPETEELCGETLYRDRITIGNPWGHKGICLLLWGHGGINTGTTCSNYAAEINIFIPRVTHWLSMEWPRSEILSRFLKWHATLTHSPWVNGT